MSMLGPMMLSNTERASWFRYGSSTLYSDICSLWFFGDIAKRHNNPPLFMFVYGCTVFL